MRSTAIARLFAAGVVAAVALHAAPAFAAAADAQASGSLAATAVGLLAKIQTALQDEASPVAGMGVDLWRWLLLLAVIWTTAQAVVAGLPGPALIAQLIRVTILAGFTWWLLPGGRPEPIVGFLAALSGRAVELLAAGAGVTGELSQVSGSIGALGAAIAKATGKILSQGSALEDLKIVVTALPVLLMLGVAEIGAFLASALVFIVAAGGQILLAAAGVLAPLFIPWLLVSYTSFLFWGWLRFAIGAALYSVVAAALLAIAAHVIDAVSVTAASGATVGELWASAMATLLVIGLVLWIAMQISHVAASIAGGHAQAGAGAIASGVVAGGGAVGRGAYGGARALAGRFSPPKG